MAVTTAPTVSEQSIGSYRAQNPGAQLTHLCLVSVASRTTAQPGPTSGFFDLWFDLGANIIIYDHVSTQA